MTDAMTALLRAREAWQKTQDQQVLDLDPAEPGLDETRESSAPNPPPGGRARLVEPEGSSGSGASPTPAIVSESSPPLTAGSSFRQGTCEAAASRAPGSRHLHVVPDPRVPTLIPLPRLLEVLSWKP